MATPTRAEAFILARAERAILECMVSNNRERELTLSSLAQRSQSCLFVLQCTRWFSLDEENFARFEAAIIAHDVSLTDLFHVRVVDAAIIDLIGQCPYEDVIMRMIAHAAAVTPEDSLLYTQPKDINTTLPYLPLFSCLLSVSLRYGRLEIARKVLYGCRKTACAPVPLVAAAADPKYIVWVAELWTAVFRDESGHDSINPPRPPDGAYTVDPGFWRGLFARSGFGEKIEFVLNELRHVLPHGTLAPRILFPVHVYFHNPYVRTDDILNIQRIARNGFETFFAPRLADAHAVFVIEEFIAFLCREPPCNRRVEDDERIPEYMNAPPEGAQISFDHHWFFS